MRHCFALVAMLCAVASVSLNSVASESPAVESQKEYEEGGLLDDCLSVAPNRSLHNLCSVRLTITVCNTKTFACGEIVNMAANSDQSDDEGETFEESDNTYKFYPCRQGYEAIDAAGILIRKNAGAALAGERYRCRLNPQIFNVARMNTRTFVYNRSPIGTNNVITLDSNYVPF